MFLLFTLCWVNNVVMNPFEDGVALMNVVKNKLQVDCLEKLFCGTIGNKDPVSMTVDTKAQLLFGQ